MFCPSCRGEYREGIERCPECDVPLVAMLEEPEAGEPEAKLVKVFQTGEAAIIPVVESVLGGAGIEFLAKPYSSLSLAARVRDLLDNAPAPEGG